MLRLILARIVYLCLRRDFEACAPVCSVHNETAEVFVLKVEARPESGREDFISRAGTVLVEFCPGDRHGWIILWPIDDGTSRLHRVGDVSTEKNVLWVQRVRAIDIGRTTDGADTVEERVLLLSWFSLSNGALFAMMTMVVHPCFTEDLTTKSAFPAFLF